MGQTKSATECTSFAPTITRGNVWAGDEEGRLLITVPLWLPTHFFLLIYLEDPLQRGSICDFLIER